MCLCMDDFVLLLNVYYTTIFQANEKRANDLLQEALFSDQEQLKINEQQKMEDDFKYRQELQQQLVNRQRQRQCQYEESLIEKKMLDDILRTMSFEDKRYAEDNIISSKQYWRIRIYFRSISYSS